MNKIFKLFMLAVVVLGFSSCYNEFEEPAPAKVWTKEDFSNSKLISIKDFKQLFYKEYGNGAASLGKTLEITEAYVDSLSAEHDMSSAEKSSQATKPVMYTNQYTSMMNHPNQPLN